jgi:site-specific recombinase XerD
MPAESTGLLETTDTHMSVDIPVGEWALSPSLPPDRHPAAVYLARLSAGSRRTQGQILGAIANMVRQGATIETFPWWQLRYQHVQGVRSMLAERYAPATANKALAALRGVLKQSFLLGLMSAEEYERERHVESVRGSRLPRGRALTAGELRSLFATCDTSTPSGARNAALVGILYGGGLRRTEAASLLLEHYDQSDGTLRVLGKGNKERQVPLPPGAQRALASWLVHRGDESGPLLCPVQKNGRVMLRHMAGESILEALHRLTSEYGGEEFSPHDLRRSCVSDLLDAGADLAVVQQIVGHSSPSTTARYDRRGAHARRKAADMLHVPFKII